VQTAATTADLTALADEMQRNFATSAAVAQLSVAEQDALRTELLKVNSNLATLMAPSATPPAPPEERALALPATTTNPQEEIASRFKMFEQLVRHMAEQQAAQNAAVLEKVSGQQRTIGEWQQAFEMIANQLQAARDAQAQTSEGLLALRSLATGQETALRGGIEQLAIEGRQRMGELMASQEQLRSAHMAALALQQQNMAALESSYQGVLAIQQQTAERVEQTELAINEQEQLQLQALTDDVRVVSLQLERFTQIIWSTAATGTVGGGALEVINAHSAAIATHCASMVNVASAVEMQTLIRIFNLMQRTYGFVAMIQQATAAHLEVLSPEVQAQTSLVTTLQQKNTNALADLRTALQQPESAERLQAVLTQSRYFELNYSRTLIAINNIVKSLIETSDISPPGTNVMAELRGYLRHVNSSPLAYAPEMLEQTPLALPPAATPEFEFSQPLALPPSSSSPIIEEPAAGMGVARAKLRQMISAGARLQRRVLRGGGCFGSSAYYHSKNSHLRARMSERITAEKFKNALAEGLAINEAHKGPLTASEIFFALFPSQRASYAHLLTDDVPEDPTADAGETPQITPMEAHERLFKAQTAHFVSRLGTKSLTRAAGAEDGDTSLSVVSTVLAPNIELVTQISDMTTQIMGEIVQQSSAMLAAAQVEFDAIGERITAYREMHPEALRERLQSANTDAVETIITSLVRPYTSS
jgi:hypothetical protein